MYNLFDIKNFAIVGGATINANFIKADLVDEIKIVIAPFIDGSKEQTFAETR
ncbi:MAG: dihydrofolate reductase family protein [Saprospiraceae bacterium]|nr:dihydrofolate reductase family protein [Candidatus Parvibacillus calidus]